MPARSGTTISMGKMTLESGNALILVGLQRDFFPGGSITVTDAHSVIPVVNRYLVAWSSRNLPIVLSRCWHARDHCSFYAHGGRWPPHCVAGTPGAAFPPELEIPNSSIIVSEATAPNDKACSAFSGTHLDIQLRRLHITQVFIGGIATDYGVLNTVHDAVDHGYATVVLGDAIRAVNIRPNDGRSAQETMTELGAQVVSLTTLGL